MDDKDVIKSILSFFTKALSMVVELLFAGLGEPALGYAAFRFL